MRIGLSRDVHEQRTIWHGVTQDRHWRLRYDRADDVHFMALLLPRDGIYQYGLTGSFLEASSGREYKIFMERVDAEPESGPYSVFIHGATWVSCRIGYLTPHGLMIYKNRCEYLLGTQVNEMPFEESLQYVGNMMCVVVNDAIRERANANRLYP